MPPRQPPHTVSTLDHLYRSLLHSKFFTKGWGSPEVLKNLFRFRRDMSKDYKAYRLLTADPPKVNIDKQETNGSTHILDGRFRSPMANFHPEMLRPPVDEAVFQIVIPERWKREPQRDGELRPMCIQLAGTGDHYFWRRKILSANPLAKENNVGSILLENPFYGHRKPKDQKFSSLHNVYDLFVMGACLCMECIVLLQWCEQHGYGPLCLTGVSMGGHMASLAASNWPKPISLVPCLSWTTASCVFTEGALAGAVPWDVLQEQLSSVAFTEKFLTPSEMVDLQKAKDESGAFVMGVNFAKGYSNAVNAAGNEEGDAEPTVVSPAASTVIAGNNNSQMRGMDWLMSWLPSKRYATDAEVLQFMRGVMDEFTHLGNFPKPVDCELIIAIAADMDAYVPRRGVIGLPQLWPGIEVRYIKNLGHVQAFIFKQQLFREAIVDSLNKNAQKYYNQKLQSVRR